MEQARAEMNQTQVNRLASSASGFGAVPSRTASQMGIGDEVGVRTQVAIEYSDRLQIHYKIAENIFVDNVLIQVVERHLLTDLGKLFRQVASWGHGTEDEKREWEHILRNDDHAKDMQDLQMRQERVDNLMRCLNDVDSIDWVRR